jgi:hypothetical protein
MTILVAYPTNRRAKAVLSLAGMLARSRGEELVVCTAIRDPRVPGMVREDPEFRSYVDELADKALAYARKDIPTDVSVRFTRMVALFIAALWTISTEVGRHQIQAGLWVFPALIFTTFVSYFGDEGPRPTLTYGTDVLVIIVLALITYAWAVKVGYRTDELDQVVHQQIRMEQEEKEAEEAAALA